MTKEEALKLPPPVLIRMYEESGLSKSAFCEKYQISEAAFSRRFSTVQAMQKLGQTVLNPLQEELMRLSGKELLALPADRFASLFYASAITRVQLSVLKQISVNSIRKKLREAETLSTQKRGPIQASGTEVEIIEIDLDGEEEEAVPPASQEAEGHAPAVQAVSMIFHGIPLSVMNNAQEQTLRSVFRILKEVV